MLVPEEQRPAKRRTATTASAKWSSLSKASAALTSRTCTTLAIFPHTTERDDSPLAASHGTLEETGPTIQESAHAALCLQLAFRKRDVGRAKQEEGSESMEDVHSTSITRERERTKREAHRTVMRGKRKEPTSAKRDDVPTLAHAQALMQALGEPIDHLRDEQQATVREVMLLSSSAAPSNMLRPSLRVGNFADCPCHICGELLGESDDALLCVTCGGEPIHAACIPTGDTRHKCQFCITAQPRLTDKTGEADAPTMGLDVLLTFW